MNKIIFCIAFMLFAPSFSFGETISQGTFKSEKQMFSTLMEGGWKITAEGDEKFLITTENFKAKKAPDLKFFLSEKSMKEITADNATKGATLIALLSSYKGQMKFKIPKDVDLEKMRTVVLHCAKYTKLWGKSSLK